MSILVNVINQKMVMSSCDKELIAGSQQFIKFRFNLDEDWKELVIFAQFRQGENAYNQYLDEDNCAYLPPEIGVGTCTLMLYGSYNKTIGTTNYLTFKVSENALVSNAQSTDISESLYNQLVTQVDNLSETISHKASSAELINEIARAKAAEKANSDAITLKASQKEIDELSSKVTQIENDGVAVSLVEATVAKEMEEYLASGFLTNLTIANDSITREKIKDNAINDLKLNNNAVKTDKIDSRAVTSEKIQKEAIINELLAKPSVKTDNLYPYAVTNEKIASGAIMTRNLSDESVTADKIADKAVAFSKLSDDLQNKIDIGNVINVAIDNQINFISYSHTNHSGCTINTEEEYVYNCKHGYTSIKGDIRLTSDNKLIMCHDAGFTFNDNGDITTYDATNESTQVIYDYDYDYWIAKQYEDGSSVCDFETYIRTCKKYGKTAFITIRYEYLDQTISEMLYVLDKYRMKDNCIVNCTSWTPLSNLREKDKNILMCFTTTTAEAVDNSGNPVIRTHINSAAEWGNCIVCGWDFPEDATTPDDRPKRNGTTALEYMFDDGEGNSVTVVEYARSKGVRFYEAVIYSKEDALNCIDKGVLGLMIACDVPIESNVSNTSDEISEALGLLDGWRFSGTVYEVVRDNENLLLSTIDELYRYEIGSWRISHQNTITEEIDAINDTINSLDPSSVKALEERMNTLESTQDGYFDILYTEICGLSEQVYYSESLEKDLILYLWNGFYKYFKEPRIVNGQTHPSRYENLKNTTFKDSFVEMIAQLFFETYDALETKIAEQIDDCTFADIYNEMLTAKGYYDTTVYEYRLYTMTKADANLRVEVMNLQTDVANIKEDLSGIDTILTEILGDEVTTSE